MRRLLACLLLTGALASAEDVVYLAKGGTLRGTILSETPKEVVIQVGDGKLTLARDRVARIERGPRLPAARRKVREEWFLLQRGRDIVGWRSLTRIDEADRIRVEERLVFFGEKGEARSLHRLEECDRGRRPLSFLWAERRDGSEQAVSGTMGERGLSLVFFRDGKRETRRVSLPEGWMLPLPAWTDFLSEARPGESRVVQSLDPRLAEPVQLLFRREADAAAPEEVEPRPCRALALVQGKVVSREFYRPEEGSLSLQLGAEGVTARRATRDRVEMARAAHAPPPPMTAEEALRYPFVDRPPELRKLHPGSGIALAAPDAGWTCTASAESRGLVLGFEKTTLYASMEAFVHDLPGKDASLLECADRARSRVKLTVERMGEVAPERHAQAAGLAAIVRQFQVRHRGELLRCYLAVVRAPDRYVTLIGACPDRYFEAALPQFEEFLRSLEIAR